MKLQSLLLTPYFMLLGFKTGPKTFPEGQRIVREDGAHMCELWFNVTKAPAYDTMFAWLKRHHVHIGLHYWGTVGDGIKPNLATANAPVRQESIAQIKTTIDMAAAHSCVYVNIHPGAQLLERIDFDRAQQQLIRSPRTPGEQSRQFLLETISHLNHYAEQRGVRLTLETLTAREATHYTAPDKIYNPHSTSLEVLAEVAQRGFWLANDITHTATQFAVQSKSLQEAWPHLINFTEDIAPQTRLIHMNTMRPSLRGIDTHDGITDEDFAAGVWPTKEQVKHILSLFKYRDDVYVVPEPHQAMQKNYQALVQLAPQI